MKKVYIVHGFGGIPNGGWFPWLMRELAKLDIFACSLPMPGTDSPILADWVNCIKRYVDEPSEDTILLGHSLGATTILRYLESLPNGKKFGGILLVAGVIESIDVNDPKSRFRDIDHFMDPSINFEKIKPKSDKFVVLHGLEDETVPFSQAEKLAEGLDCKLISVPKGKHFSQRTPPIYYELPEALKALEEMMK